MQSSIVAPAGHLLIMDAAAMQAAPATSSCSAANARSTIPWSRPKVRTCAATPLLRDERAANAARLAGDGEACRWHQKHAWTGLEALWLTRFCQEQTQKLRIGHCQQISCQVTPGLDCLCSATQSPAKLTPEDRHTCPLRHLPHALCFHD